MSQEDGARFSPQPTRNKCCCAVNGCYSKACKDLTLRFHSIPRPRADFVKIPNESGVLVKKSRRDAWAQQLKLDISTITDNTRICSLHFKREDYILPDFKMPKTSPERSRETRQRKTVPKLKRPAKTVAERSRDYRARRKAIENAAIHTLMRARSSASVLISDDKSIANQTPFHQNLEDTHVDMPENQYSLYMYLNPRNSLDEQQVDYNNRPIVVQVDVDQQDLPLLSGNSSASTGQIQSSGENGTTLRKTKKVAKTAAERCREYRARLKAAKDTTNIRRSMRNTSTNLQADDIVALQEVSQQISTSKTPAERSSEYRARKRACKNATEPQSTSESSSSIQYSDNNVISREPSPLNEQLATQQNPTINIINSRKSLIDSNSANDIQTADSCVPYSEYRHRNKAHHKFKTKCIDNSYRKICSVCDRLSFKAKLRYPGEQQKEILTKILPKKSMDEILVCNTCMSSLKKNKIPAMSTYNGFKNSQTPTSLPPLDLVSEKLISPRIPVVQIPKLGHVNGQFDIYGQVINVPVSVDTIVKHLPRNVHDHRIKVHVKRKKNHKTSCLDGIIKVV